MTLIKKSRIRIDPSRISAWFLIGAALLAGCSGAPKVTSSGFLPDYALLQPDPARWRPKVGGAD